MSGVGTASGLKSLQGGRPVWSSRKPNDIEFQSSDRINQMDRMLEIINQKNPDNPVKISEVSYKRRERAASLIEKEIL